MATVVPGEVRVEAGTLISTNPTTGRVVGMFDVATAADAREVVARAREAGVWWAGLGFRRRAERLRRWRADLARRLEEVAALVRAEGGKPRAEAIVETAAAIDHIEWAATNAQRVLAPRRVPSRLLLIEHEAHLEYQPLGTVGVIGPWNYPVLTPVGSLAYALAAGNAIVFKPSEYTPAVGQWLVDSFRRAVPEQPVLQVLHGSGEVGALLCRAGVDKIAFTGSTGTGKRVMAACAETLTPVLIEAGGKDALLVDEDADLQMAADACCWGAMTNAGQTCLGIERAYVVDSRYDEFLTALIDRARTLRVGAGDDADIGPITMPRQLDVIRRHLEDAVARGGRAVLGGPEAVRPPYVWPTILVDVPDDAPAMTEETFGPTVAVTRVHDLDEAVRRSNAIRYGLGGAVFGRARAMEAAAALRTGMVSVNSALAFIGVASLPYGGVGDSGFGRTHGDDGLREFARAKAITRRRGPSLLPAMTFDRRPWQVDLLAGLIRLRYGR
jgi:succinate-semialdehyde dehydrogenase/glutarate-semialdehyde dehydrogenase